MNWWGKIIGGTFGFMLGGPLGALFGATIGHNFDKGLHEVGSAGGGWGQQERVQTAFFTATFSIMGCVCKADGQVSEDELALARQVMTQMDLNEQQKKAAIALFGEGKKKNFPVDDVLRQLRQEIGRRPNLIRMFIEIQLYAAFADGVMHPEEKKLLYKVCSIFGVSKSDFENLATAIKGEVHHRRSGRSGREQGITATDAYAVLGVSAKTTDADIKKAYRRLLSQHHPDKLVSKGLPEEMMKIATQRTHEIRQAYEKIKQDRNF